MPSLHTLAVHAGERGLRTVPREGGAADRGYVPVVTPVYHSVGYTYEDTEDLDDVFAGTSSNPVYTRYGSPTVAAVEAAVCALEGGDSALAYGSGMAAIHGALLGAGARTGTAVVAARDVYGATFALLTTLLAGQGVTVCLVDTADLNEVEAAVKELEPVALLAETISNPLLKVADLRKLADLAHTQGAAFIVDNTFATPVLCRPLLLGADYVVHSATKYLGGHGDVLGGITVTSTARRKELLEINKLIGANLGPQDAWLIHRGIKTVALRVTRQCQNAAIVAAWLAANPMVGQVNYPGLASHPQHAVAQGLLGGELFGAMVSFDLVDRGRSAAFAFMEALTLIQPATTLGDVYSLVLYPAMSSHRALDTETRRKIGIGDGLLRLSIGIEDPGDIIGDLEQAFSRLPVTVSD